jgi:hypothetical protein
MGNIRVAAQEADYTEWFAVTLLVSLAAFPILWAFAWRRFSGSHLTTSERLRLSAKTAGKAILPLWGITSVVGFFVVMFGIALFMWSYTLFFSPPGGINLSENAWLLDVPYWVLFSAWYIFTLTCVIRWLPNSPNERFVL